VGRVEAEKQGAKARFVRPCAHGTLAAIIAMSVAACSGSLVGAKDATTSQDKPGPEAFVPVTAVPALDAMPPADLRGPDAAEAVARLSASSFDGIRDLIFLSLALPECPADTDDVAALLANHTEPRWTGNARFRCGENSWSLTAEHLVVTTQGECSGRTVLQQLALDGRVVGWGAGADRHFAVDLLVRGHSCESIASLAAIYEGHVVDRGSGRELNGQGQVGFHGWGKLDVRTENQLADCSRCNTEPLSGTTEARSGGDVLTLRYDGATSCTDPGQASFSLNGEPAGTVDPPAACCSMSSTRIKGRQVGALGILLVLAWAIRSKVSRGRG
jgi:hypothetical protein